MTTTVSLARLAVLLCSRSPHLHLRMDAHSLDSDQYPPILLIFAHLIVVVARQYSFLLQSFYAANVRILCSVIAETSPLLPSESKSPIAQCLRTSVASIDPICP